jgi:molybdopterin converting factor small subunit
MKVKVHYISLVKTYTGKSQEEIILPNEATLSQLLDKIATTYGKPFNVEVYDFSRKEVKPMFVAMVNGIHIDQLGGIKTALKEGDSVILMTLMTGG